MADPGQASPLLITGCYRSGTTVLEKCLHMHPQLQVASQPFPVLYFFVKARFLEELGLERRYPLDHLFGEEGYGWEEWHAFLEEHVVDAAGISSFFDIMEDYTEGLWTPEMLRFRDRVMPGTFFEIYSQLNACIAELFPNQDARYLGGKEVLVEEYAPYLLECGATVLFVIRDPRAVITSLNFRDRDNLTGENRPILFSLRAWRKSVAIALGCAHRPRNRYVRYEDLVTDQNATLRSVTDFLGVPPFDAGAFAQGLVDQRGRPWRGNSSFADLNGITAESLRTFEDKLPAESIAFIEAVCGPEMAVLGYACMSTREEREAALRSFKDPFKQIHGQFPSDYSSDPRRLALERERLARLDPSLPELDGAEARKWFISAGGYARLRESRAGERRDFSCV